MMIVELLTMVAHIVSTLIYMLVCLIKKPVLQLSSPNFADERRDFLQGQRAQLNQVHGLLSPLVILVIVSRLEQDYFKREDDT